MSFFELQRNYFVAFMVDESILMAIFRLLALLSHHGSVRDVNAHTREAIAQRRRPVILQWDDDPSRLVNIPRPFARFKDGSKSTVKMRHVSRVAEPWRNNFATLIVDEPDFVIPAKRISILRRLSADDNRRDN